MGDQNNNNLYNQNPNRVNNSYSQQSNPFLKTTDYSDIELNQPSQFSDNFQNGVQTQIPQDVQIPDLVQSDIQTSGKFKVRCYSLYSWMIMWVAIAFTIITSISALVTYIFYKMDYRPQEIGWYGFAPFLITSIIWAIINAIGYWFLDEDNHIFATIKYVITIIEFSCVIWWLSFICLFPERYDVSGSVNQNEILIDASRIFTFIIPTLIVSLLLWALWALIAFVPTLNEIGSWSMLGIGSAVVIVPSICINLLIMNLQGNYNTWEYLIFFCVFNGILFILFFIFFFVMFKRAEHDTILTGVFYAEWLIASYLIVLVVAIIVIMYSVKWIIKAIHDR